MVATMEWTRDVYESSVARRCWWYTPYDAGWDGAAQHGEDMSQDQELRQIADMERELGPVPDWAQRLVEGPMRFLPPCGHYLFPRAFLEVATAIGCQTPPVFIHGCYTADRRRKERMVDYLVALDAWLAGVGADAAARELSATGHPYTDWPAVCSALWGVLGERVPAKEMMIGRLVHRLRWWIKSHVWDDDNRTVFCRDQFLGDVYCRSQHYGNVGFGDPWFTELDIPRVKRMEGRIRESWVDADWFISRIRCTWLCAPKAFRFVERVLWALGQERKLEPAEDVPSFLRCEDTYLNQDRAAEWWRDYCDALDGWWQDQPRQTDVARDLANRLGEPTDHKRWLVRLLRHRVRMLARYGDLKRLVDPQPMVSPDSEEAPRPTKRGTATLAL